MKSVIFKCCVVVVLIISIFAIGRRHGSLRGASKVDTSDIPEDDVQSTVQNGATAEMKSVQVNAEAEEEKNENTSIEVVALPEEPTLEDSVQPEKQATEVTVAAPASTPSGPTKICGRYISINLSDHDSWPTPYTPSYFEKEPTDSTEAVLVQGNFPFGNTLIVGLFHAIDLAYDKQCEVYITKSCTWIWDVITPWFYGKEYTRDDAFYKTMEEVFGIHVVDDPVNDNMKAFGKTKVNGLNSMGAFKTRSQQLTAEQLRNRRDTIFRNLFALPNPQCDNINAAGMNKAHAMYTFIDVPFDDAWNARVQEFTGHEHNEVFDMKPEYVKSILKPLNMLEHPIFLQMSSSENDPEREEVKRLIQDPELKTDTKDVTNDLYMAVLADVFIGNPCSHWSLMVARMRLAFGLKNTFVYTERQGDKWVSFVEEDNYLELYNITSPWFG